MKKMKRWASVLLILCMLLAGTPAPAESGGVFTGTPTAEQSAEPANTATAEPANTATAEPENTATAEPENTATAEPTNTATAEPENTATAEPENTATAEPENTATAEPENTATTEPENTATAEPENTATAEPANTATAEPENTATAEPANTATAEPENTATAEPANTAVPTDAAEVKTIAFFEAVAPEGLAVPQGTLETDLGLPASLNAQFSDGAAGEVAVAWQCAAGYDPSAEAGTQFAFAAVLPEGYALAEGVSLPQILVTLTPPLANAMLMAEGILDSGEGWTLFNDGKLTVKGDDVKSDGIPSAIWSDVKSIEVAENASFTLNEGISFSGSITVLQWGSFYNYANLSGDVTVLEWGHFWNKGPVGKISGGTISGQVDNDGTITGGKFTGTVNNSITGSITGGDFTGATVNNDSDGLPGSSVTGGAFNGFTMDSKTNTLTITGNVDLSNGSLHPLTIALDAVSKIVVDSDASFNAGSTPVAAAVECNGTITGQPLRGLRRSQARLRHSLLHWAYFGLFRALRAASVRPRPSTPSGLRRAYFALLRSTIRNSRLATLPLASLLCSLDFRFACFAHCARRSSVPRGARFVRPLWERGAFWIVALPYEAALPKSLLSPRGAFWMVVRCREQHCPKAVL